MNIVLAIIFSTIPVAIILGLIYYMGEVRKQPLWLVGVTFGLGILSWVIVRIVSNLLGNNIVASQLEVQDILGNIGFFLVSLSIIAIIEELSKFLIVNLLCVKNPKFKNPYDGIIYATTVSLGFAFAENIMYISNYGMSVALSRAIFTIPAHACFGILMGYFIGLSQIIKKEKNKNDYFFLIYTAFFVPFLVHGIYDYLLNFSDEWIHYVFIAYSLLLIGIAIFLIIRVYKVDVKKLKKEKEELMKKEEHGKQRPKYKNIYSEYLNTKDAKPYVYDGKVNNNWVSNDANNVRENITDIKMFNNDEKEE